MEPETKTGGFTIEEKAELKAAISDLQTAMESKSKDFIKTELAEQLKTINEANRTFATWKGEKDAADAENQKALDKLITDIKALNDGKKVERKQAKTLAEAIAEKGQEIMDGVKTVKKGKPFSLSFDGPIDMSTKSVADMTLANTLTGDSVITYNQRQAILPAQKTNFRDLIPSVQSETGLYVTYKESGSQGGLGLQTEGSAKSQIDYDFTEVQTVNKFIAGFARFSRQIAKSLPWLQNTLPRLLMRDFFMKENRYFYDVVATAATGSTTTQETDDIKQLIDWIANQNQANFSASYGLLSYKAMATLNKLLYVNGYYQGSGGVLSQQDGSIRISGVPILPVSWVPSNDKVVIIDNDFIERVEVEGLSIAFSEEDANNFTENKLTARIECYEELNAMLPASIIVADFGNSSTS
jgi:HK97 family phage major capsid protein